uniref:Small nuclear ribonucleoprotein G n=2 Tax=Percomorphaceae TaxID=1489872 RepID=A0A3Q2QKM0_FUNHE
TPIVNHQKKKRSTPPSGLAHFRYLYKLCSHGHCSHASAPVLVHAVRKYLYRAHAVVVADRWCRSPSGWVRECRFMDKKLSLKLNGGRHVQGILRGFDPFMNLVVDDSLEMGPGGQQNTIGMVVIRGNSIIMLEALERV